MEKDIHKKIETRIRTRGVRPTAVRILVFDVLWRSRHPLSMADIEASLQTVDRSSVFRALSVFLEHHLIHGIDDGSGSVKYEVCKGEWNCSVNDMHVHFFCEECHHTFCFHDIPIPVIPLPAGFLMNGANFVVKGVCPACSAAKKKCR